MRKVLCGAVLLFTLTGCTAAAPNTDSVDSTSSVDSVSTEVVGNNLSVTESSTAVKVYTEMGEPVFAYEKFPLILDGELIGWGKLNLVERLGIWDWYVADAVTNGIKYSYAVNVNVELLDSPLEDLQCKAFLVDKGVESGVPCEIGWSGFSNVMDLMSDKAEGCLEATVQPICEISDTTRLRLDFSSSNGINVVDSIYFDNSVLADARKGADILTANDAVEIVSINGAKYSLEFRNVFREVHKVSKSATLKNGNYLFYDFQYKVSYLKKPTSSVEVKTFDSFNKNKLTILPDVLLQSDSDATKLGNSFPEAERREYENSSKTFSYVTKLSKPLKVKASAYLTDNRLLPASTVVDATYVRVILQFSDEAAACSESELRDFNGRYCVWQLPLTERKLEVIN